MVPYDWANGGSVDDFQDGEYGFSSKGSIVLFQGMGMEFKDKIMLHCFREVKCQQGFTTGVIYNLDYSSWM